MPSLYPRKIKIYRPTPPQDGSGGFQVGNVGYSGLVESNESLILSNIPASIQAQSLGNTRNTSDVVSDSAGPTKWQIFIPKSALSLGAVKDRDIVVDDLGDRYQVASAYWNVLGYKLMTIRLEN